MILPDPDLFDTAALDALTPADLRARGSLKWTAFPDTIGAWVAEMDLPPAPEVTAALTAAVQQGAYGYLAPEVVARAQHACADWYRAESGWQVQAGDVWLVPDVLAALAVTLNHVAGPGSVAVVTTPAYMPFLTRPQAVGHEIVTVAGERTEQGRWVHDLAALDAGLAEASERSRAAGARPVLVLCNPWNPVGRVLTRDELFAISEIVQRHNAVVFSDEIHAPLRFDGAAHVPYASVSEATAGHTITAVSASKTWNLAGLKCAQIVVTDPTLQQIMRAPATLAGLEAATLGAVANAVAYRDGGQWRRQALDYLRGNRETFGEELTALPGARYTPPEGTYLAWVDLRGVRTAEGAPLPSDLGAFFRERAGVAITDGAACGAPGFIRFNLALPRPLLRQAVRAMVAVLDPGAR